MTAQQRESGPFMLTLMSGRISANFARVVKRYDAAMALYLCGLDREISVQEQF